MEGLSFDFDCDRKRFRLPCILQILMSARCHIFFFLPVSFFGIRVDETKCTHCGACVRECKMDVKKVCDRECIQCGECIAKCPMSAISYGFGKKQNRKREVIIGLLLFGIAGVLTGFGLMHGGLKDVMSKAIRICYECMGIG